MFDAFQVYSIADSQLCLTGTAEVPLAGLHMDALLPASALPLRMAAFGRAFRTEAGAAGSASRGLYRLHQFSKVGLTHCSAASHPAQARFYKGRLRVGSVSRGLCRHSHGLVPHLEYRLINKPRGSGAADPSSREKDPPVTSLPSDTGAAVSTQVQVSVACTLEQRCLLVGLST